jgi:hypothetical protein
VRRQDVQIPAPDGYSNGTLHIPDGDGPWPGVLVCPDAGGARETFRHMGDLRVGDPKVEAELEVGHTDQVVPAGCSRVGRVSALARSG